VREIEKLVRKGAKPAEPVTSTTPNGAPPAQDADIVAVQRHLEEFLGLTVRIKPDADLKSGAISIRYTTLDQLDMVCQRLTGGDI